MGSQTFYPREGSVGMWAAIGLLLRVWVERKKSRMTGEPLFGERSEARGEKSEVGGQIEEVRPVNGGELSFNEW